MNEHIKELAEQAHIYALSKYDEWKCPDSGYEGVPHIRMIYSEKFAELIVQKCADVAYETYWHDPKGVRGIHIKEAIKEYFGVGYE